MTADPSDLLSAGLDDAIADVFAPEDVPDPSKPDRDPRHETFRIEDDRAAEWAARKMAKAHRRVVAIERMASDARQAIDSWEEGEKASPARDREFFEGLLEDYALRQREEADRKSFELPSASISTRSTPAKIDVSDDEAYIEWAVSRDGPDQTIKTTRKPLLTDMRKTLEIRDVVVVPKGDGDGQQSGEMFAVGDDGGWPDDLPVTVTDDGRVVDGDGAVVEGAEIGRQVFWVAPDGKLQPVPGTYERPEKIGVTVKVKEPTQ